MEKQDRNALIAANRSAGKKLREIAAEHGISPERARQIAMHKHGQQKTLAQLPGTEHLSPATRGLLYRIGYRDADTVLADIKSGKLRFGCAFGMGRGRFQEILAWAKERNS